MKTIFISTFLLLSTLCSAQNNEPVRNKNNDLLKTRNLFNGKNLDGWKDVNTSKETWKVVDGELHCTGKPIGVLRSERQYENFILEIEWKHMKKKGNSGVFIWSDIIPKRDRLPTGLEVQMLELDWINKKGKATRPPGYISGELFGANGYKLVPENPRGKRSMSKELRCKGAGEWNKYVIVAVDGAVKLSINGKFVNAVSNGSKKKGYICLESEGSEVHFRNIRITELPGGMI
ncbi:MAG: DUF1080 domain-containing protein, partial [Lentisphaeraceae bacterium]|nr:DUF1080 domain-containing protein [Lentisphaeraceae bacterium]